MALMSNGFCSRLLIEMSQALRRRMIVNDLCPKLCPEGCFRLNRLLGVMNA